MYEHTTPMGIALAPFVNKPTFKHGSAGRYSLSLRVPRGPAEALRQEIDERVERRLLGIAFPHKRAPLPYTEVADDKYVFRFRTTATGLSRGKKKYKNVVYLFDSLGQPSRSQIVEGNVVRVAFEYETYYTALVGAGVALHVRAVQLIDSGLAVAPACPFTAVL